MKYNYLVHLQNIIIHFTYKLIYNITLNLVLRAYRSFYYYFAKNCIVLVKMELVLRLLPPTLDSTDDVIAVFAWAVFT